MKIPQKIIPIALAALWLPVAAASAASFTTDFSLVYWYTAGGGTVIDTNRAILTPAAGNQAGSVIVWDSSLDNGAAIESFNATFKLQIGPGSANPADGVSFNFVPGAFDNGQTYTEEGPGGTALTIAFDTYDNGIAAEGVPTPSLDVRFGGKTIATHAFAKSDMVTSKLEDVAISLDRRGAVTVSYKGQLIHDHVFVPGWVPTNGLFIISGRTGGEYAEQDIAALSIDTVLVGSAVTPTITLNPVSATVNEGGSTNFTVAVDGTAPFYYQWMKNGAPISGATDIVLNLGPIYYTDNNAKIKCQVTNPAGNVTSTEATLTVVKDTTPPTVVKAAADSSGTQVVVTFSEPVSDTALSASHYAIDQGIGVTGVTRLDASRVVLTTATMPGGRIFTLTINGVQDMASSPPNTIAANTQVTFASYLFQLGAVLHKKYLNFDDNAGWDLNNLFNDPRYPNFPDRQELMSTWEYPAAGLYRDQNTEPDGPAYRNYFDTLEGYFIPPTTGDYVFYATGGDMNQVFLSTDADPVNKHRICNVTGWTNPRDWNIPQGNDPADAATRTNGLRSDYFLQTEWPTAGDPNTGSALIHLNAGQRYYMLAVHHDFSWSGADDFGVTYTLAGAAVPAAGTAPALTGSTVGTYLDPTGASVTFVLQPADVPILQGRTATFTASATGQSVYGTTVTYQWQTAPSGSTTFTNIPGATSASITTPVLGLADNGRQYQVLATVPGLTQPSRVATVTVSADTVPPHLVAASALPSSSGSTFDVGITFDEPVTQASAETMGNYTLSAGTLSAVKYLAGSPGVVLTVSGLTVGSSYNVTVVNVADGYGNAMSSGSLPFTVSGMHWGAVGADELGLGSAVLAVGTNAFDVYSDGIGEWAAYDEATLVYEPITGDFDKEVRVEYQDPSSQWARAGLIARDVTNIGVDRNGQTTNSLAGRYQKIHVNPVMTAMGTPGNNTWEANRRLQTGLETTSAVSGVNSNPKYPNAWCRLQRVGQTFNYFRSDDGVNWVSLGSTVWPAPAMPDTLYVGLDYSPENGNVNPTTLRKSFVAKYRDYRTHQTVVPPPAMSYVVTPTGMTITFEGTLQSADSLTGSWTDMTGVPSPYAVPVTGSQKFYRAKR